jgi:hypothetical protein
MFHKLYSHNSVLIINCLSDDCLEYGEFKYRCHTRTYLTTSEFVPFIQDLPYLIRICSVHTGLTLQHQSLFCSYRTYLTTSEFVPFIQDLPFNIRVCSVHAGRVALNSALCSTNYILIILF